MPLNKRTQPISSLRRVYYASKAIQVVKRYSLWLVILWLLVKPPKNVKRCLIQEIMHNEFKMDDKVAEAMKNIYCTKDEGVVDHINPVVQKISFS